MPCDFFLIADSFNGVFDEVIVIIDCLRTVDLAEFVPVSPEFISVYAIGIPEEKDVESPFHRCESDFCVSCIGKCEHACGVNVRSAWLVVIGENGVDILVGCSCCSEFFEKCLDLGDNFSSFHRFDCVGLFRNNCGSGNLLVNVGIGP